MQLIREIYNYRELLKTNVKKDIRGKYKGSFLGILWSFLNPLLQVVVYAIVFPYLMRGAGIDNYVVYLVTGIIPWNYFSVVITTGTTTIKNNEGIIKEAPNGKGKVIEIVQEKKTHRVSIPHFTCCYRYSE